MQCWNKKKMYENVTKYTIGVPLLQLYGIINNYCQSNERIKEIVFSQHTRRTSNEVERTRRRLLHFNSENSRGT